MSRVAADVPTTIFVLLHLAEKLEKLHASGLCHRDLKPANVLWRPTANVWTLMDFGCAAAIGAPRPHVHAALCPASLCAPLSSHAAVACPGPLAFGGGAYCARRPRRHATRRGMQANARTSPSAFTTPRRRSF